MGAAELIELGKLGLQIWFAMSKAAGLSEEEEQELLNRQRDEFTRLTSTPLKDV